MLKSFLPFLLALSLLTPAHAQIDAIKQAAKSVVRITGPTIRATPHGPMHGLFVCSGEVIQQNVILTANHCTNSDVVYVDSSPAKVTLQNEYYDLAILEVLSTKPPIEFRDTPVDFFEHLTAMGYAFGFLQMTPIPVTVLIPNMVPARDMPPGIMVSPSYIGGMSGGPVIDADGKMVGIVQDAIGNAAGYGVGIQLIKAFLLGRQ